MIVNLYAIKDTLVGFQNPWLSHSNLTALRATKNAVETGEINNVEDKQLWLVGSFDDTTGSIISTLEHVGNVIDLKEKKDVL